MNLHSNKIKCMMHLYIDILLLLYIIVYVLLCKKIICLSIYLFIQMHINNNLGKL